MPRLSLVAATAVVAWLLIADTRPARTDDRPPRFDVVFAPTGRERKVHALLSTELARATRSVDVAMFAFTSRPLAEELGKARRRGCAVRVLLDRDTARDLDASQHALLAKLGVSVKWVVPPESEPARKDGAVEPADRGQRDAKFHHKFCVIDGTIVLTGSFNWTIGADEVNHENLVRIEHAGLAQAFSAEFDRVWNQRGLAAVPTGSASDARPTSTTAKPGR